MPITLTSFEDGDLCHGHTWTVDDEDELADQIATVALGQAHHVQRILAGAALRPRPSPASNEAYAISLLTVTGADPWHRDGWIFQIMSWIAAHRDATNSVIKLPHMIHAHKGFDGLKIEIDPISGEVTAAIIFEDKATENPRTTVREKIWLDFGELENGARDNFITSEVVGLLLTRPDLDPDQAIENVIWKQHRHYRISITIEATHSTQEGRGRLFEGYRTIASGSVQRRQAETFFIQELRAWMSRIADKAIARVRQRVAGNV